MVCVVNGLRTNLLGLPAITALNIVARVDATSTTTSKGNNTPELRQNVKQELKSIRVMPKVDEPDIYAYPEKTKVILGLAKNQHAPPWPD